MEQETKTAIYFTLYEVDVITKHRIASICNAKDDDIYN